jgi:hypothetical protein
MPRRFLGIRLLLGFVALNTIMFLMLVISMTRSHPWLAYVLPGKFETGVNSSGYWVFFSLVLLVDAVTVLFAGLVLLLPAMRDGAALDERRLARHLVDRGGLSVEAKDSVLVAMREEVLSASSQIFVGRFVLLIGALVLAIAFFTVSLSFTRALPDGQMFMSSACEIACHDSAIPNATVKTQAIEAFTADQIAATALLGAPEVYDLHVGTLTNNTENEPFSHFVFAFRIVLGLVLLLIVISFLRRGQKPELEKKTMQSVEAAAEGDYD